MSGGDWATSMAKRKTNSLAQANEITEAEDGCVLYTEGRRQGQIHGDRVKIYGQIWNQHEEMVQGA